MKFLIILLYWERLNVVRNALTSIKNLDYDNWELAFLDDGSTKAGEPLVREILKDHLHKVKFYNTHQTLEDKIINESSFGKYVNEIIANSDSDIVIVVCDDDALVHTYLTNLNTFFTDNPEKMWGYCHVAEYNPEIEAATPYLLQNVSTWYNRYTGPLTQTSCVLDSSQVVFRRQVFQDGVMWPWPRTGGLDSKVFEQCDQKYNPCYWVGCIGQYKAVFQDQMGKRPVYTLPRDVIPT